MSMKEESYRVNVFCQNCEWHGTQDIPKGSSVEVLSERECPICGCREIKSLDVSQERPLTDNQWFN